MQFKKLYTAGDGYCFNHHWPMWSELLHQVLELEWTNLAAIGSGNELIANFVLDALSLEPEPTQSLWVIQWTQPKRWDILLDPVDQHQDLIQLIKTDPVYYKNFYTTALGKTYWASSASQFEFVLDRNNQISDLQHENISRQHMVNVAQALDQAGAAWRYLFTYPAPWAKLTALPDTNIVWTSQREFRRMSQYAELDVGEIQPVSSIHLDFLEQYILSDLVFDVEHLANIKHSILEADTIRRKVLEQNQ
jgi:hypothetical protein